MVERTPDWRVSFTMSTLKHRSMMLDLRLRWRNWKLNSSVSVKSSDRHAIDIDQARI